MENGIPDWLNTEFLTEVVQEESGHEIEIFEFNCQPAIRPGENFLSNLIHVKILYKLENHTEMENKSLIVKHPTAQGFAQDMAIEFNAYEAEMEVYNKLLPLMRKLFKHEVAPRSYFSPLPNILVLEDMKHSGYVMGCRQEQLDFDHCKLTMIALARFHAMSLPVLDKIPQFVEQFGKEPMFRSEGPAFERHKPVCVAAMKSIIHTIKSLGGCNHYADMIHDKLDTIYEDIANCLKPNSNLNVLNHGDPWTNNIQFKYDKAGNVFDAKLVDYQLIKYCSPGSDLIYFLWSSAKVDVREHKLEELYNIYCETFNSTAEEHNWPVRLTKDDLLKELHHVRVYAIEVAFFMLAVFVADEESSSDFNALNAEAVATLNPDKNPIARMHARKRYRAMLPNVLKQLELFGAFS